MLLEPSQPHGEPIRILAGTPAPRAAVLLVGPEGGWAAAEVDRLASAGFRPLTLGPRTLRADAAPIVALALLRFIWGDL
jgi:16S rRNA (uracil1498-N3)-methyltransferase